MNVINIIRSIILSAIGFAGFAVLSIILIGTLFSGPNPDGMLTANFEKLVAVDELAELGYTFADVASGMFIMIAWLNVWLLALAYIYIIILDTINISLHWLIKSGIFTGLIILIDQFFLKSTIFSVTDMLSSAGALLITTYTTIYYLVMFLIILVVQNWLSKKHV